MSFDYKALRARSPKRKRSRRFDPVTRAARDAESNRRCAAAGGRALGALRQAFPDEYRELYLAARAEVWAERGPLPGDPA